MIINQIKEYFKKRRHYKLLLACKQDEETAAMDVDCPEWRDNFIKAIELGKKR